MIINSAAIIAADTWIDAETGDDYIDSGLAQDWARVAKITEETGEAIAELISWSGQNPRKGKDDAAFERMLAELADTAVTAILAIQHFTKDARETEQAVRGAITKLYMRVPKEYFDQVES